MGPASPVQDQAERRWLRSDHGKTRSGWMSGPGMSGPGSGWGQGDLKIRVGLGELRKRRILDNFLEWYFVSMIDGIL